MRIIPATWIGSLFTSVASLALAAPAPDGGAPPLGVVPPASELSKRQTSIPPTQDGLPPTNAVTPELSKPETDMQIDVNGYSVPDDASSELKAALPEITARFIGKNRSFEDLGNAAAEVTRFMQRELGYYLGYAYIGPQKPGDGLIRISIMEGRLDHVELDWSDDLPVSREIVEGYLSEIKPGAILTVRDVERAVFLINDLHGISTRVEVKAGSTPGTAILVVTPKADALWNGRVDADVNGSHYIGKERLSATVTRESPLARGDGLSLTLLDTHLSGLEFMLAGYNTPVGAAGWKVGASFSAMRYRLDEKDFPIGIDGDSRVSNVFTLYPWVRSRNLNLFMVMSADHKAYVDRTGGIATDKDIDDFSPGITGDFRDSMATGGVNSFALNYMRGHLRFPGGAPSGIDDASSFGKLTYSFTRLQNLVDNRLLAYASVHGQVAFQNLDTTEQFRAGGPDDVRAFAFGEGVGDSGLVGTLELRMLPSEAMAGRFASEIVTAAFIDAASVQLRHDPNLVTHSADYVNRAGYSGAGVSLVWSRPNAFTFRASLAKPIHGRPTSSGPDGSARLYAQGSWFF